MGYGAVLTTLNVGDNVSIARNDHSQGIYTVTKINKVRVEVARAHDGYIRKFSMKTGLETGSSLYHSAHIETVANAQQRDARQQAINEYNKKWSNIELCVKNRDIKVLKQLVDDLFQAS